MAATRTIVVAGAGIGGLTATLALAAQGFRIVILEKAERLDEIGAGLQLSPNASRVLIALGLFDAIAARATAPDAVSLMSARAGGEIARLPFVDTVDAPYWVIHRADLQSILLEAVRATPAIELRLGHSFETATLSANGVTVRTNHESNHTQIDALALIGADGVWSAVRQQMFPNVKPTFSGLIAWRGTIDATQLPQEIMPKRVQVWMGSNAHIVLYPIASGRQLNVVVITRGKLSAGGATDILKRLAVGWPPAAQSILNAADQFTRYTLFTMPDGGLWNAGPMTLLGDAAHAMLPFAAQGAGMAIEDAAVLAACIGPFNETMTSASIAMALATYADQRRGRIARVQRTARQSGAIYHLRGPIALARDLVIRALGGQRLLARQNWIYDWRG